jgi:hypothetical protein
MKGLIVHVYRPNFDCTNGGVTSHNTEVLLVGEGIPEIFEAHGFPVLKLVKRQLFGDEPPYLHAQPVEGNGYMFGGNFIYSSDGRFPGRYPIPVHDRQE